MEVENQQLEQVSSIRYPVKFKKGRIEVQALINSHRGVNAMTLAYAPILELTVCFTNVGAQKIDEFTLLIHVIVFANFQIEEK